MWRRDADKKGRGYDQLLQGPKPRVANAKHIDIECVTTEDTSDASWGSEYFALLSRHSLVPKVVGNYEPIRTPYTPEGIPSFWEGQSMFARGRSPKRFLASAFWTPRPSRGSKANFFSVSLEPKLAAAIDLAAFAQEMLLWSRGLWATVSTVNASWQQYNPLRGSAPGMLPGVFWANLFGPAYESLVDWEAVKPVGATLKKEGRVWSLVFSKEVNDPDFEDPQSELVLTTKAMIGTRLFLGSDDPLFPPQVLTGDPTW